eukprot:gene1029-4266_t
MNSLIFAVVSFCIFSVNHAATLNCLQLDETVCSHKQQCAWNSICKQCNDKPCELNQNERDCPTDVCSWNSTLNFCYKDILPCYARNTELACLEAGQDCTWKADSFVCTASADLCLSHSVPMECKGDNRCTITGTHCHAKHLSLSCDVINDRTECSKQTNCKYESFSGTCYEKGDTDVCFAIGLNENVCNLYPECSFNTISGCVPYDICSRSEKLEAVLSYSMTESYFSEYIAAGMIPPSITNGPTAYIEGTGISHSTDGLVFDEACVYFPAYYGATLPSALSISTEVILATLQPARHEVIIDLSSDGNPIILIIGPGNTITLFARRNGKITVAGTARDKLTEKTSIQLVFDANSAKVFVNDDLAIHGIWQGAMLGFRGDMWFGCSSTRDSYWHGTMSSLTITSGTSSQLHTAQMHIGLEALVCEVWSLKISQTAVSYRTLPIYNVPASMDAWEDRASKNKPKT